MYTIGPVNYGPPQYQLLKPVQVRPGAAPRKGRPRRHGGRVSAALGQRRAGDRRESGGCLCGAGGSLLRAGGLAAVLLPHGEVGMT